MPEPFLSAADRVLVLAPHPDDESLATGTLLLRARAAGAAVLVAFVTSGENNPWAQRVTELRLRLAACDQRRFGQRREGEALQALAALGLPNTTATFLHFPDQGLTPLLRTNPEAVLAPLVGLLETFRPTLLAYPALADLHPDHSALGVFARVSLGRATCPVPPRELQFFVHRPMRRAHLLPVVALARTPAETAAQRQAVAAHRSQMVWRRRFMFAFLAHPECFTTPEQTLPGSPLRTVRPATGGLYVAIRPALRLWSWGPRTLVGVVEGKGGLWSFSLPLAHAHRRGEGDAVAAQHHPHSNRGERVVAVSPVLVPAQERCFVKLERRWGFFDPWGWVEVPPLSRHAKVNSHG
jgi:N-acetyl-1-D-myo-inositol-2-amino-2-deoxy-alpha-D-glucopyranoside deacetylase